MDTLLPEDAADAFDEAAELLSNPGAWAQGEYARTDDGKTVDPSDERASCWCPAGAVIRVAGDNGRAAKLIDMLHSHTFPVTVFAWNDRDGRNADDAVELLKDAGRYQRSQAA